MDVLRPPIVTIGGRCYRRNPAQMTSPHLPGNAYEEQGGYTEQDDEMYDEEMYEAETAENVSCDPLEMEKTRDGYRLVIDVPSKFFGLIIGSRGETKKRLEHETRTQIHIPRGNEHIDEITISGKTRQGVSSAKTRIDVMAASARQKTPFTHFVAVPLNSQDIMDRFQAFREDVLKECKHCSGVDERIFQIPQKLHLTIVTLVLLTKKEVKAALEILNDCLENIINPILQGNPLLIDLAGLEYMNDDPGKVDILYGKVRMQDGTDGLQEIANRIQERFVASELCQDSRNDLEVKLHATLMNSIFRAPEVKNQRSEGRGRGQQQRSREAFDASEILELFGDFSFGELRVNSLHLVGRGRCAEDGSYWAAGKVPLP
ncbi:activating signal cointegrator 1 complex subunit 1 [Strongylocentrotus purpuratus]|uniref:K Homology domain-containing protein n=1 Tax=Strongylocentrotus purpuratus TaxID=7668 RepID=A0A7M7NKB1_STRPU|nr:activating signal cointegrator 1 complex subunit 1 [Strongylocentrotus purpuratus]